MQTPRDPLSEKPLVDHAEIKRCATGRVPSKTSTIYCTPQGFHIDLGKIVAVHPAVFVDRHDGWFVSYQIDVQLRDSPIVFTRKVASDECGFEEGATWPRTGKLLRMADGSLEPRWVPGKVPLCVANLQREVDDLVAAWQLVEELRVKESTF